MTLLETDWHLRACLHFLNSNMKSKHQGLFSLFKSVQYCFVHLGMLCCIPIFLKFAGACSWSLKSKHRTELPFLRTVKFPTLNSRR